MLLMLTDHVNWQQWTKTGSSLDALENALNVHFVLSSTFDCWLDTICLHRDALKHFSVDRKRHASVEVNLGNALRYRGQKEGDATNLEEAVLRHEAVVELYSPDHPDLVDAMRNLGESLHAHSKFDEEIALHRRTLKLCQPDHPQRFNVLSILGEALMVQGEKNGDFRYLEEVIALHQEMFNLCPAEDPRLYDVLNKFGGVFLTYGEKSANLDYLTKAIASYRKALELCLPGHPRRLQSLENLGNALMTCGEKSANLDYLTEAISSYRKALELCLPGHPRRVQSLRNLGNALMTYGENSGDADSLAEAVTIHRKTLELKSLDHFPDSALMRGDTSRSYRSDYLDGLEKVIALYRETTETGGYTREHLDRAELLTKLGEAFEKHAINNKDFAFLGKSVFVRRIALTLHPPRCDNGLHRSALNSLAKGLSLSIPVFFTPDGFNCDSYLEGLARVIDDWESNRCQEEKGNVDNSDYPEMLLRFGRILVDYDEEFGNYEGLKLAVSLMEETLNAKHRANPHDDDLQEISRELLDLEDLIRDEESYMAFENFHDSSENEET
jgi:tetratricopeptide (TPR) repeat protein